MGMTYNADKRVEHAIENGHYDQAKTITLKLPLIIPYVSKIEYEPATGDFEHQGEFYTLIGRQYVNDTLYIVCLRNDDQKRAAAVLSDLVKQSTGQSTATQNTKGLATPLKDYNPSAFIAELPERSALEIIQSDHPAVSEILYRDHAVPTPPPDFLSC
jgi:hypothetical protein